MRAHASIYTVATAMFALAGCSSEGVSPTLGATEPLQVRYPLDQGTSIKPLVAAQFMPGTIPMGTADGPAITMFNSNNNLLVEGQANKKLTGDAAKGATAIALRLEEVGTGYWVVPTGSPDPATMGDITWEADCNYSPTLPSGMYTLQFAAVNAAGVYGPANELHLTVASVVPAGKIVISLAWDSNADLDLRVGLPDGRNVSAKTPATEPPDSGFGSNGDPFVFPPGTGIFDRDSNARCVQDNYREEDLVFADAPPPGTYLVYADMFTSCGAPAADFVMTVRQDGVVMRTVKGRLIDLDADNGTADGGVPGLLVDQFTVL